MQRKRIGKAIIIAFFGTDILRPSQHKAGWLVQDLAEADVSTSWGMAVREFPLSTGEEDYLLGVDGEAVGVIEAKKSGTTLSDVKEQSALSGWLTTGSEADSLSPLPVAVLI